MTKKLLFIGVLFFAAFGHAQIWQDEIADDLYSSRDYSHAIPEYEKLIKLKKNTPYLFKLGMCYYYLKDYKNAQVYLDQVKDKDDAILEAYLYDAICEHYLGMYNEAKSNYLTFQEKGGLWPNILNYIKSCDFAMKHDTDNHQFVLDSLVLKVDGHYLGGAWHMENLVYSEPDHTHDHARNTSYPNYKFNDVEGEVVNDKGEPLFHQFYTGGICFTPDGKHVYFTRNESDDKFIKKKHWEKHGVSSKGINTLGIYRADVEHSKWTNIVHLDLNSFEHSCMHPSLANDGNRLYFSSNREGGFGGYDLYYADKTSNGWGEPVNLGKEINSLDDEMFPYVLNDSVLFFASNGHIGYGGADIYFSHFRNGNWETPSNPGKPINSSMDDFGLIFSYDDHHGFFASDRDAEPGKDNIYSFSLKRDIIMGRGIVLDKLSLKPIPGAHVKIHTPDSIVELVADQQGRFTWNFFEHHRHYHIEFEAETYIPEAMDFEADTNITLHLDKHLEPVMKKDKVFTFNDILFEYNKADLLPDSKIVLDRLAEVLLHSGAKVELSAHTDSRGSDRYNLTLSQKRALSAVNYLISKGVAVDKAIGIGYGETKLKNHCDDGVKCSEEEHTLNRRVEIKVIEEN